MHASHLEVMRHMHCDVVEGRLAAVDVRTEYLASDKSHVT
jgi:hypothetical protein